MTYKTDITMITTDKVTEIFCILDEFCKNLDAELTKNLHTFTIGRKIETLLTKIAPSKSLNRGTVIYLSLLLPGCT